MVTNLIAPGHQRFIDANLAEYGPESDDIQWITETKAVQAEKTRGEYIRAIRNASEFLSKQTKPW